MATWAIVLALTLTAALSPLLTFLHLWQTKEWRWDRLLEHVRRDGVRNIFGLIRPGILALYIAVSYGLDIQEKSQPPRNEGLDAFFGGMDAIIRQAYWFSAILVILAGLSVLQMTLRKQRYPRWTGKTALVCVCSIGITALLMTGTFDNNFIRLREIGRASCRERVYVLV